MILFYPKLKAAGRTSVQSNSRPLDWLAHPWFVIRICQAPPGHVQLGKTAGKDTAAEKTTYPALFGVEESLRKADALIDKACAELDPFGTSAAVLRDLARFLVERKQ